jgi:hypothetical protein
MITTDTVPTLVVRMGDHVQTYISLELHTQHMYQQENHLNHKYQLQIQNMLALHLLQLQQVQHQHHDQLQALQQHHSQVLFHRLEMHMARIASMAVEQMSAN